MKNLDDMMDEILPTRSEYILARSAELIAEERQRRADRAEKYARAICRVFVVETARILRIKVSPQWIQTRVDHRWKEYVEQANAVILVAEQEIEEALLTYDWDGRNE